MELAKFLEKIKECKHSLMASNDFEVKCSTNHEHTFQKLFTEKVICPHCKSIQVNKPVYITFKIPQRLTIFEAGLLYAIFSEKKIPKDYASYHKCQAGIKFIENIKEVKNEN